MKNIEVEIQVAIKNVKEVEKKIKKVGKFVKVRKQVDQYFVPKERDFFAKNPPIEYLRIREENGRNHINYSFLRFDKKGFLRATDEYETIVENPKTIFEIFKKIGLILKVVVIKKRKYFDCGDFEVTVDEIKNLGNFMEVEAKKNFGGIDKTRKACQNFLDSLNIDYEVKKEMGYPRMLYKKLFKK